MTKWIPRLFGIGAILLISVFLFSRASAIPSFNESQLKSALVKVKTHRPTMIDFYADWCPICVYMKRTVLADSDVKKSLSRFTVTIVDSTRKTDASESMKQKYHVYGLPTYIFLDSNGNESSRLVGQSSKAEVISTAEKVK